MRCFRAVPLVVLAPLLGGCMVFGPSANPAVRHNPMYQQGYADGCSSATSRGAYYREQPARDDALYRSSQLYRTGWGAGFNTCRGNIQEQSDVQRPIPDTEPGMPPGPSH